MAKRLDVYLNNTPTAGALLTTSFLQLKLIEYRVNIFNQVTSYFKF